MIIRKPRLGTLLDPTYAKHYSHSVKCYVAHFKYLDIHNGSKTVAMDTLDYTGHISTTIGSNDMIEELLESQNQLLYLTLPTLSIILTPSSATSQPLQNCQTLQWFLSPLYLTRHLIVVPEPGPSGRLTNTGPFPQYNRMAQVEGFVGHDAVEVSIISHWYSRSY